NPALMSRRRTWPGFFTLLVLYAFFSTSRLDHLAWQPAGTAARCGVRLAGAASARSARRRSLPGAVERHRRMADDCAGGKRRRLRRVAHHLAGTLPVGSLSQPARSRARAASLAFRQVAADLAADAPVAGPARSS